MSKNFLQIIIIFSIITLFTYGCRKKFISDDPKLKLSFNTDTLTFDTVFTTVGSATRGFNLINRNKSPIKVSNIRLMGGQSSNFRINIDGVPGIAASDLEIPSGDSLHIFVEVTVDPNNDNNPFVIYDSIQFRTNGNTQYVYLEAWGQNAFFFRNVAICDTSFTNIKPYVFLDTIVIPKNCKLTIEQGSRLYFRKNAFIAVLGTLEIKGSKDSVVTLQGDRLEDFYDKNPGQWSGIFFTPGSKKNRITHAEIRNSVYGIVADSLAYDGDTNLVIRNTIIKNIMGTGFLGVLSVVKMENLLIYNCGQYNAFLGGGVYDFNHCTFANNYSNYLDHRDPVLLLTNYKATASTAYLSDLQANFINSIIYGSLEHEIGTDTLGSTQFNINLDHCLVKAIQDSLISNSSFSLTNVLFNQNPLFVDPYESEDFHLTASSPCLGKGKLTSLLVDIEGMPRPSGSPLPDLGCYEMP